MRIVFLGTPEFAVPSLEMLCKEGYEVVAAVTQPDRPKGRGKKMLPPPVKVAAQALNIPVLQFERIRRAECVAQLEALNMDLMITAAYGQILSPKILELPRLGCINVHGSLLPGYRGAAPIQWAIMNGEKTTGITTMFTDAGVDTGDMLLRRETPIGPDETGGELYARLADIGAQVLKDTLHELEAGTLTRMPQDEGQASHYPMIDKKVAYIHWDRTAAQLHDHCRALDPAPFAWTRLEGQSFKIARIDPLEWAGEKRQPGTILAADPKAGLIVACGDGAARVGRLLAPGGKWMSDSEYLRGKKLPVGAIFEPSLPL